MHKVLKSTISIFAVFAFSLFMIFGFAQAAIAEEVTGETTYSTEIFSPTDDTKQAQVVARVFNGLMARETTINISDINATTTDINYSGYSGGSAMRLIIRNHPLFSTICVTGDVKFNWSSNWKYCESVSVTYDSYNWTETNITAALTSYHEFMAGVPENATEVQKALYVHDWVCANTSYGMSKGLSDFALGVLANGQAVCGGFAQAYKFLCNQIGLECNYIQGTTNAGVHAWDQVKVDGFWYQVDTTWDRSLATATTFSHTYCLLNDTEFAAAGDGSHSADTDLEGKDKYNTRFFFDNKYWTGISGPVSAEQMTQDPLPTYDARIDKTSTAETVVITYDGNGGYWNVGVSIPVLRTIQEKDSYFSEFYFSRDGYDLAGWYFDEGCTKPASWSTTVTEDATVYAGWLDQSNPVAQIGDKTYTTLTAAFRDAIYLDSSEDSRTVINLLQDVEENVTGYTNSYVHYVKLDLNGHTLRGASLEGYYGKALQVPQGMDLLIVDGSSTKTGLIVGNSAGITNGYFQVIDNGMGEKLTLDGVTVRQLLDGENWPELAKYSSFIGNGSVYSTGSDTSQNVRSSTLVINNCNLVCAMGDVYTGSNICIENRCGSLTITNSTILGEASLAIYNLGTAALFNTNIETGGIQSSVLEVYDGSERSDYADSSLHIYGGEIKGSINSYNPWNGGSCTSTVYVGPEDDGGVCNARIYSFVAYDVDGNLLGNYEFTGGYFKDDPSRFVPSGYEVVQEDGWYKVQKEGTAEPKKIDISTASIGVSATGMPYTGKEIRPDITVDIPYGPVLTEGEDYTVGYKNNVNAGTATIIVTGTGNYYGTLQTTFTINKATPNVTAPKGLTAKVGQTLSDVKLPARYSWIASGTSVGSVGTHSFKARYLPSDTKNYDDVVLDVDVTVSEDKQTPQPAVSKVTMYRLYNPWTGEHFYTSDAGERDNLKNIGWNDEGVGWTAPSKSNTPVYRLYNKYVPGGDHHYTTSASERDNLVKAGWSYEGAGWYSDDSKSVPLYRQYNPYALTGTHNYTTSKDENDNLVKLGWKGEGVGWYGVK